MGVRNHLWLAERTDRAGYEETEGVVVCGPSAEWVRIYLTSQVEPRFSAVPVEPRYEGIAPGAANVCLRRLGVAAKDVRRGEVLHAVVHG